MSFLNDPYKGFPNLFVMPCASCPLTLFLQKSTFAIVLEYRTRVKCLTNIPNRQNLRISWVWEILTFPFYTALLLQCLSQMWAICMVYSWVEMSPSFLNMVIPLNTGKSHLCFPHQARGMSSINHYLSMCGVFIATLTDVLMWQQTIWIVLPGTIFTPLAHLI